MTVAQQKDAVDEVANAGQLVRGDDRRDAALRRLRARHERREWLPPVCVVSSTSTMSPDRGAACGAFDASGDRQETRELAVLDRARVDAAKASETVEQRGGARTASAEYGDALSLVHLEAGGAKHPDARRASGDAGGVALPRWNGREGRGARANDASCARRTDIDVRATESTRAGCLASGGPEASYATRSARRDVRRIAVQVEGARQIDGVTTLEPPAQIAARSHAPARVSPQQWKSGIAAWLGWLFDGLDMHLYTLVATPVRRRAARRDDARPIRA